MQQDDGVPEKATLQFWKKEALIGATITKGQGSSSITWTVWSDVMEADIPADINNKYKNVGVKQFDFQNVTTTSYSGTNEHTDLLLLLIHIWPGDWQNQISHVNSIIDKRNDENATKI